MKVAQIPSWGFPGVHCFDYRMFYCWRILSGKLFLHRWRIGDFDVIIQFVLIFVSRKLLRGLSERPLSEKTGFWWQASNSSPWSHVSLASMQGTYNESSQLRPRWIWSKTGLYWLLFYYFFLVFILFHTCVLTAFSPLSQRKKERIVLPVYFYSTTKHWNSFFIHPCVHLSNQLHTPWHCFLKFI